MSSQIRKLDQTEFLLYTTEDGKIKIQTRMQGETIWLNINQMAELFGVDKSGVSRHLKNIFETGELSKDSVVAIFATTASDNKSYNIEHFNLDAIISVGYRVNSIRGTQFRIWATQRLKEYIIKGFALDDARLKQAGGGDYFDELLARIRDIRSSEKLFYQKILGIYATSIDYDPKADVSQNFFATIQNKVHWAAHGHTAAEIVWERADASKPFMGLTNWIGDSPRKHDAKIAKNYLTKEELDVLNKIVSTFFDFAELQAMSRRAMYMKDWITRLEDFIKMSGREILNRFGTVTHEEAIEKANKEYEKYHTSQINSPSSVEKHFSEIENTVKKLKGN